jgi:hypothetical protein
MKTDFNRFGKFSTAPDAPSSSWWATPELQGDRKAFEKRLVDEAIRMMNFGKFKGHAHMFDKGLKEK